MTLLNSFIQQIESILGKIVASNELHAKWLNTLSYLENCGARKIAACEHPTLVKEEMLKHAAEEFRHAHYLKRQIQKISFDPMPNYSLSHMLGGMATLHYLSSLDLQTSRYLKTLGFSNQEIREMAYLLVTYAIELRAEALYPVYDSILRKAGSRIAVKSILLEEKEHLNEMKEGLKAFSEGFMHAERVCAFEEALCKKWIHSISNSVNPKAS
jgi:bacterioferritin (cytochrome b1)